MSDITTLKEKAKNLNNNLQQILYELRTLYSTFYGIDANDQVIVNINDKQEYATVEIFDVMPNGELLLNVKVYESIDLNTFRSSHHFVDIEQIHHVKRGEKWFSIPRVI